MPFWRRGGLRTRLFLAHLLVIIAGMATLLAGSISVGLEVAQHREVTFHGGPSIREQVRVARWPEYQPDQRTPAPFGYSRV